MRSARPAARSRCTPATRDTAPTSSRRSFASGGRSSGSSAGASRYRDELDDPLVEHRVGHLHEARDVGAVHVVAGRAVLLGRLAALLVDRLHDVLQAGLELLAPPAGPPRRLRHLTAPGPDG